MFAFSRFLLYFTEVARQGSFRKASEALHVSASSIDRQILRVEQELAMPLFERHPTGLRLTAAGELLLHAANNWKKDFTRVCEQLDDLRGLRRGHVRIATIDAINRHFFSTMLKEVHKHYPNISFTLTTINNIHIQQALISGEADFGIMLNPQTSRELQVRAFAEMNMGIVVPTGHPLASRSAVRFSQCLDYPFILPSAPLMISEPVEALPSPAPAPGRPCWRLRLRTRIMLTPPRRSGSRSSYSSAGRWGSGGRRRRRVPGGCGRWRSGPRCAPCRGRCRCSG